MNPILLQLFNVCDELNLTVLESNIKILPKAIAEDSEGQKYLFKYLNGIWMVQMI